ncbi:MAG TPA: phosphoribosylaminoimidazolesuccinocarboxamide synthase [Thermoanaerobaculia bacterium]|jgi:phosphoribosylaminoimidazole-succinocarboxamide synthase|nr:phosphoribosylaminoimidazolesuccinocarboxamide synthase [Thermoanaerobaculia bacterium]
MGAAITETALPFPLSRRGKVRDVYEFDDDRFLFVATDRISAFDVVLSPGIPDKGTVLTQISNFWFRRFPQVENHLLETEFERFPADVRHHDELRGRSVMVKRCDVIPIECVARGYLVGSGLKEYKETGSVCGIRLEEGLTTASKLREPIFTPATKEDTGHDINISFEEMSERIGSSLATELRDLTLSLYQQAAEYALTRGIIIADTKFEFGLRNGKVVWIDEALTPDSSRFWPAEQYKVGSNPPSFDKQYVRDWLETTNWDKNPPAPELPAEVVEKTREKYIEAYQVLTGEALQV